MKSVVNETTGMPVFHVRKVAFSADQGSIADMATPLRAVTLKVSSETIPDCGHFIPDEQPEKLAEILADFLTDPQN